MSERKVLNKYYPPDYDPTNIPRLKLPKTRQYTVRVMTPCNMKCNTCGDYIAKAKKFNARKETVEGEEYLGLKIYRFYFKCPICMAEITFKTDPKNQDYELEHGATRNFQAYRLAQMQAEQQAKDEEEEEKLNPMKMLENRTKASRREMQELEDLEELKELSQRTINIKTEDFLEREKERRRKFEEMKKKQEDEEDEEDLKKLLEEQNKALLLGDKNSRWTIDGNGDEVAEDEGDDGREDGEPERLEPEQVIFESSSMREHPKLSVFSSKTGDLSDKGPQASYSSSSLKRKLPQLVRIVKKSETVSIAPTTTTSLASLITYSDSDSE
jgi:hypothetical protein